MRIKQLEIDGENILPITHESIVFDNEGKSIPNKYQVIEDENLSTENKTIVGAINELFQNVDSGKEIIADAIDNESITKDSTFTAMGEAITDINVSRENDRKKLIEILRVSGIPTIGDESMDSLLDLIVIGGSSDVTFHQISCGNSHTFILKNDGTVWACGWNDSGQLGIGNFINQKSFCEIKDISDIKQIACGDSHTFILKNDGTIWGCGYNYYGQLGMDGTSDRSTFEQVPNISNVKQIDCGINYTFILKDDNSIWCTGQGSFGRLGLGDSEDKEEFTLVADMPNVERVSCGDWHTFIVKKNGTIWACGRNTSGQLGLNDTKNKETFIGRL